MIVSATQIEHLNRMLWQRGMNGQEFQVVAENTVAAIKIHSMAAEAVVQSAFQSGDDDDLSEFVRVVKGEFLVLRHVVFDPAAQALRFYFEAISEDLQKWSVILLEKDLKRVFGAEGEERLKIYLKVWAELGKEQVETDGVEPMAEHVDRGDDYGLFS